MSYADTYSLRTATATLNDIADAIDGIAAVGWLPVSDSWSYASVNTITVPSGAASIYNKGNCIRLVQSSTTKYFYIVAVADTVLTITGGSTYTLTNATISSVYYSQAVNPVGFPSYFALTTPTFTTTGTAFTNAPTIQTYFKIRGNLFYLSGQMNTNATSGGTGIFKLQYSTSEVPNHLTQSVGSAYCLNTNATGLTVMENGVQAKILLMKYDSSAIAGNGAYVNLTIEFLF